MRDFARLLAYCAALILFGFAVVGLAVVNSGAAQIVLGLLIVAAIVGVILLAIRGVIRFGVRESKR